MKGDLPFRKHVHSERVRFIAYVLWLHGSTQTAIGNLLGLRKKQVAGIVDRSEYGNRASLSLEDRRRFLGELREVRAGEDGQMVDDGVLPDAVFAPRPLKGQST